MDKEKELPQRKRLRFQNFDYNTPGAYFITICTKDRKMLFTPVGADSISARMVEKTFLETIRKYDGVDSPIYVVMPNHFHAIITISRADMESAPTGLHFTDDQWSPLRVCNKKSGLRPIFLIHRLFAENLHKRSCR